MSLNPEQRHSFAEDLRDVADKVERGDVSSVGVTFVDTDGEDVQFWIIDGQTSMLVGSVEMLKAAIIDFELTSQMIDDPDDGLFEDDA